MGARSRVQSLAKVVGVAFLAMGILGLLPGVGIPECLGFPGVEPGAAHLGVFPVSLMFSVFHIGLGVTGLLASRTAAKARSYLIAGGSLYVTVLLTDRVLTHAVQSGVVIDGTYWVRLAVGAAMMIVGVVDRAAPRTSPR